jgi:hypothetical protein
VVRNHWWNGFGIRVAAGFRLYNVSGLDAVELRLKSGEVRRIGTDDPQGARGSAEISEIAAPGVCSVLIESEPKPQSLFRSD